MTMHLKQLADRYLGYFLIAFFLPLTRLLGVFLRRNHSIESVPENILFIKILGLGSLIASSESIKSIRKKYPTAKIILLADAAIADGIKPFGLFDELWTIKSGSVISVSLDSMRFLFKSWKLKKLWVVDLEVYSKLTTIYSLMTTAINRFGFYLRPVFFRKYLNTHNILFDQSTFLEDNYGKMSEGVTGEKISQEYVSPLRRDELNMLYVAINNTCSDLALVRKLPDSTLAEISHWLLQNTSYRLAFLGAPKDVSFLHGFISRNFSSDSRKDRIVVVSGNDGFESYYRFLEEQCAFMITIDSGPLHIAKALGIPNLSLWGPTNPSNYLKILPNEKERYLFYYNRVPCSPCVHYYQKLPCGGDNFCMKTMESSLIIEKIKALQTSLYS